MYFLFSRELIVFTFRFRMVTFGVRGFFCIWSGGFIVVWSIG